MAIDFFTYLYLYLYILNSYSFNQEKLFKINVNILRCPIETGLDQMARSHGLLACTQQAPAARRKEPERRLGRRTWEEVEKFWMPPKEAVKC